MIQCPILWIFGFNEHYQLLPVVNKLGHAPLETISIQLFLIKQELIVLNNVELYWQHRSAHHFQSQGVSLFLTQQTTAFYDSHPITSDTTCVRRLIHIFHTLGHIDKVLTLHCCFAIERFQQLRLITVVIRNLLYGYLNHLARIASPDYHLTQLYHSGLKSDLQRFCLSTFQGYSLGLVAQMRHGDAFWRFSQFEDEGPIIVCHHRYAANRDTHLGQRVPRFLIYNCSANGCLLSQHHHRNQ